MKIKCTKCGKTTNRKIGNYWFKESGLDNVYLENIPVYECSCGTSYPSIFRLSLLNQLIARTLLQKPALLAGKEIRFLRKNLRLASKDFSQALSVGNTTLSKWENDLQQHTEKNDRLIRATYIILKKITDKDVLNTFERLTKSQLTKADAIHLITAVKLKNDYDVQWKLVAKSYSERFEGIWVSSYEPMHTIAYRQDVIVGHSPTEGALPQTYLHAFTL